MNILRALSLSLSVVCWYCILLDMERIWFSTVDAGGDEESEMLSW